MNRTIPPRVVIIPVAIKYDRDIAPVMRDTWEQIYGLAWESGYEHTPPLTVKEIAALTGKTASTIYGHLASLRDRDALRWNTAEDGKIIVHFDGHIYTVLKGESGANSENLERLINIKVLNPESDSNNDSGCQKTLTTKSTIEDAVSLYREVTGHFTFPPGQYMATRLEIIQGLLRQYGHDVAKEKLTAAWKDWQSKRRKDSGVPYSAINTAWIDYAMVEPSDAQPGAQVNPDGSVYV